LRAPSPTVSAYRFGRLMREEQGREAKAELRRRMRLARDAIPADDRVRMAEIVAERLLALPEATSARTVLLFYSFGSEVATRRMIDRIRSDGKRVLLPFLEGGVIEAAEVRPGDDLVATGYGPREPARRAPVEPADVDAVVAPGLAFDRAGRRLGYGGGYYDRYFDRLRPDAVRVGIAFSVQLVDEVPAGRRDRRVQIVVTEAGAIDCRPVQ
jgi:5-formyltetrahydrofolate cyclo-ligase